MELNCFSIHHDEEAALSSAAIIGDTKGNVARSTTRQHGNYSMRPREGTYQEHYTS